MKVLLYVCMIACVCSCLHDYSSSTVPLFRYLFPLHLLCLINFLLRRSLSSSVSAFIFHAPYIVDVSRSIFSSFRLLFHPLFPFIISSTTNKIVIVIIIIFNNNNDKRTQFHFYVYLLVHPFFFPNLHQSATQYAYLNACLSACVPTHPNTYLHNYLSTNLPTYLPTYPPTYLPIYLPTYLLTNLSVCLYVCLSRKYSRVRNTGTLEYILPIEYVVTTTRQGMTSTPPIFALLTQKITFSSLRTTPYRRSWHVVYNYSGGASWCR